MTLFQRATVVVLLTIMLMPGAVAAATLKAGAAKVEITPPLGLEMYGFANRTAGARGVLDPLLARVLVLEAGERRLAIVALDLGEPPAAAWTTELRQRVAQSSGISYVIVAATHTHSGPEIRDQFPPREGVDWESKALAAVAAATDDAHRRAVEAKIGTGYGSVLIGHNRLRVEPNGTVTWFERNNTMVPTSPVDPTVSVLRLDDVTGKPIAVLVNYACHPVVFGSDNLQYSADYPGVAMKLVERELGAPVAMFLQGGDGDINPYFAVHPMNQDAIAKRDWTGERLGREAARVAQAIRTEPSPDATIEYAEDVLAFEPRWNTAKFLEAVRRSWGPTSATALERRFGAGLRAPMTTVLINRRIALMTMPGEPFVDYQIDWRNRCAVRDAFFAGYANDSLGYIPTIRAASLGGYGASNSATYLPPDAGGRFVDRALVRVYEMLGKLRDVPDDLAE